MMPLQHSLDRAFQGPPVVSLELFPLLMGHPISGSRTGHGPTGACNGPCSSAAQHNQFSLFMLIWPGHPEHHRLKVYHITISVMRFNLLQFCLH